MDKRQIVYKITEILFNHLGEGANPEQVKAIVRDMITAVPMPDGATGQTAAETRAVQGHHTAIITVFGKSKPGIVAGITTVIAEQNVDITDITQTLLGKNFAMIVIVDLEGAKGNFNDLKERLTKKGEELGVSIFSQHEELFQYMHTV